MILNERLYQAVGVCGITIYNWDLQTDGFLIADYSETIGIAEKEIDSRQHFLKALVHPDDRDRVSEAYQLLSERKDETIAIEYRILTKGNSYKWFEDRGKAVEWNNRGYPLKVSGVLVDISDRKMVEEKLKNGYLEALTALEKVKKEKHAILLGLRDLARIHFVDSNFLMIWSNRDLTDQVMIKDYLTPPDFCYKILHDRMEPCTDCIAANAMIKGNLHEREDKFDDGRFIIRRGSPVKDSSGGVRGVVQIALDVTTRRKTEEDLKTTDQFLQSLLKNSPAPICLYSPDGRIGIVNPAWEEIFGLKNEDVAGKLFHDIFSTEIADRFNTLSKKVLRTGVQVELEQSIDSSTGLHHFHTVQFPLQDTIGKTFAVGSISVDVTARKLAEQELTEKGAELNRKSQQLSEMNTALRVLLNQKNEDQRELEERIMSNVNELVLPYVHKLKTMSLNEEQMSYLEIIETHLKDIVAPFLRQITSQYPHMTARELEVATLVREGKSNKEMADLLKISVNAVEIHRYNLRKKLGLQNKKINLRSYLLSLNKLSP